MHILELDLHLLAHLEVQSTQRLVEKQDLGLVYQRAGDSDTLLLTAGQRADASLLKPFQVHQVKDPAHFALDHILGSLFLLESESNVIVNIHMGKQSISLKNRIDRPFIRRKILNRFPVQKYLARRRHQESRDHAQSRRLATARRS